MKAEILLIIALVMSVLAFVLYGVDKHKAQAGKWRIPEAVLLGVGLLGGSMGALLGMYLFRHKTKHWYFWAGNWLGFVLLIAALWYFARGSVWA